MKLKHRRLFGQNNRNARHFFSLSAVGKKSLSLSLKKWRFGAVSVFLTTSVYATTPLSQQLNNYVEQALAAQFPDVAVSDFEFLAKFPNDNVATLTCKEPMQLSARGGIKPGNNTIFSQCSQPMWQAYIPVSVAVFKEVVVATEPLSRQNRLDPSQLTVRRMDIGKLRLGYFTDTNELAGFTLQRTVKAGQVITPYIAKAPALVERGDWVTIIGGRQGLTITMMGQALKAGKLGEQIPVKNLSSNATIRAWVMKKGVVSTKK